MMYKKVPECVCLSSPNSHNSFGGGKRQITNAVLYSVCPLFGGLDVSNPRFKVVWFGFRFKLRVLREIAWIRLFFCVILALLFASVRFCLMVKSSNFALGSVQFCLPSVRFSSVYPRLKLMYRQTVDSITENTGCCVNLGLKGRHIQAPSSVCLCVCLSECVVAVVIVSRLPAGRPVSL